MSGRDAKAKLLRELDAERYAPLQSPTPPPPLRRLTAASRAENAAALVEAFLD